MKSVVHIGVVVLALATGAAIGFYFGVESSRSQAFFADMVEVAYYSSFVAVQRSEGNDAAYEESLRAYLELVEARNRKASVLFPERWNYLDLALTHARLSALAKKRGATEVASGHLAEAAALCPKLGWRECSSEKILTVAERLDKRGLFGSGAAD